MKKPNIPYFQKTKVSKPLYIPNKCFNHQRWPCSDLKWWTFLINPTVEISVSFLLDDFKDLCIDICERSQHTLLTHCILWVINSFEGQGLKHRGNFFHRANRKIFIHVFSLGSLIQGAFVFVILVVLSRRNAEETWSLFTDTVTFIIRALKIGTFIYHLQLGEIDTRSVTMNDIIVINFQTFQSR